MIEPNFVDEIDCSSFFDHIDDLLDFPADDVATADASVPVTADENHEAPAESFFPAETDALPASESAFLGDAAATDLSAELSVPYEDIVQLEWLSNFVEESFSGGSLAMKKVDSSRTTNEFQISSPVSVLESTNTCSSNKIIAPRRPEIYIPVPCVRARSKRHRPATFNPHPVMMQLTSPDSSVGENVQTNLTSKADYENFAESHPVIKLPRQGSADHSKKKRKTKLPNPLAEYDTNQNGGSVHEVRKCTHCEITKTPQWRAGPMGPKTLCNACGVRYKSGRLFPEYRPAASPTFCPAVHSNSHKKVLEMRIKIGTESGLAATDSGVSPELIPNTNGRVAMEYM